MSQFHSFSLQLSKFVLFNALFTKGKLELGLRVGLVFEIAEIVAISINKSLKSYNKKQNEFFPNISGNF